MTGIGVQSLFGVIVVLGLVVGLAWLLRRGAFGALRPGSRSITVETAMALGERRSLVIVAVEGRRLLLGMTPGQISMVTELDAVAPVPEEPARGGGAPSFEQLLVARAREMFSRRSPSAGTPPADSSITRFGDILKLGVHQS
jgi:flagellar protein FliO/FliZ